MALRWILMFDAVTCAIPVQNVGSAEQNFSAADLPSLSDEVMQGVRDIYEKYIKNPVHYLW
jgi:aryl-alcohol dehydrogenase-like predicted oxidoreductase